MTDIDLLKKYVKESEWEEALSKLKRGYPIQYIIGNVDFCGLTIKVNESVLIPRFETEYLVEKTIKLIKKFDFDNPKILDIGTGSGCIAISLKRMIKSNVYAIDISKDAIKLAKRNAKINNVDVFFKVEDMCSFTSDLKYDVIISNPPYVKEGNLVDEKTKYEPQNAIFAPDNGLFYYKAILERVKNNLNNKYLIAFEIDDKEGEAIKEIAKKYLPKANVLIEKDYNNYERYVFIFN